MFGAILGDMIGAPYEFDRGNKTKDFPLFSNATEWTDDTIVTLAVAEAMMDSVGKSDDEVRQNLVAKMKEWAYDYPYAPFGGMFRRWLFSDRTTPYGSFGNGSGMRVSPIGWMYDTLADTQHYARLSADVTHNHPEGIKGAEAIASAIFMARTGHTKDEIRQYIEDQYKYDLSRSCDEIRPAYHHVETCQESVPEAITAFLEGENFEDVIRTAVSLGGDTDTVADMAGSIAEAFYGIPSFMLEECLARLDGRMQGVLARFERYRK